MPKNPKLRTRLHVRRRARSRYPDYSLQQFVESAGSVSEGVNPRDLMAAFAECDELWELVADAATLKASRDTVIAQIEKVRNRVLKPFEKKAKEVRKC
jgi:hypothetical protein